MPTYTINPEDTPGRFVLATDRAEDEPCERGTVGCCVNHTATHAHPMHDNCETW
jgi:hypothetical protein